MSTQIPTIDGRSVAIGSEQSIRGIRFKTTTHHLLRLWDSEVK
jgi:hypothetical protein